MKAGLLVAFLIAFQQNALASGTSGAKPLSDLDRAVIFVVQKEAQTGHLEKRRDVCVSFDTRMAINQKGIISELRRSGLRIHNDDWCIHGRDPRGMVISVGQAGNQQSPGVFELPVDLSDWWPIQREGAHFGTLLRRGTYTVRCKEGSEPELVSYSQTCCSEAKESK